MAFRFAHPAALALLLLPLVIAVIPALRRQWLAGEGRLFYSDIRLMYGLPVSWRVRLRYVPDGLRVMAWLLLVIALARPQAGFSSEVLRGRGVDIVLAVDISNSMAALDFEPQNRLEAAKSVIANFIVGRRFDRIGIVVFARNAFHVAPLTLDYTVLLELLRDVRLVGEITGPDGTPLIIDGTAIGLGIASAANMLRQGDAASRVIILLTDGDNNAALDPLEAASAADVLGLRIHTIGMGRSGLVNVPNPENPNQILTIESDLNEPLLQTIAMTASGTYFRAQDLDDLQRIYNEIDSLEQSDVRIEVAVRWQDRVQGLLLGGFVLLLLERLLRRTVFQTIP